MKMKKILLTIFLTITIICILFSKNKANESKTQETDISSQIHANRMPLAVAVVEQSQTPSKNFIPSSSTSSPANTPTQITEAVAEQKIRQNPTNLLLTMNLFNKLSASLNSSSDPQAGNGSSGGFSGSTAQGSSSSSLGDKRGASSSSSARSYSSSANPLNATEKNISSETSQNQSTTDPKNSDLKSSSSDSSKNGNQTGENFYDPYNPNHPNNPDNSPGNNDPDSSSPHDSNSGGSNPGNSDPDNPNNPGNPDNNPDDPNPNPGDNPGGEDPNSENNNNPFIVIVPRHGPIGKAVVLTLANKKEFGEISKVTFGQTEATFKVTSQKTILTSVPLKADGGIIKVTTKSGKIIKSKFNFYVTIPVYCDIPLIGPPFYYTIPYVNGLPPVHPTPPNCYILPQKMPTTSKLIRTGPGIYPVIPANSPAPPGTVLGYVFKEIKFKPDLAGLVRFHSYFQCYVF
jgi:hypothetical protein